jgi:two-component system heavy metal sensor histidine kinase CusS
MSSTEPGEKERPGSFLVLFPFPLWQLLGSAPLSLAARLTAWYAASALTLLIAAVSFLYWALVANLDREDDEFLADKIHVLRTLLRERPATDFLREEVEWEPAARRYGQVYVRILDADGRPLLETPGMAEPLPPTAFPAAVPAAADPQAGAEVDTPGDRSFRLIAARAVLGGGEGERILQVAFDRTHEEHLLARYRRALWLALGAALVLCLVVGYRIARRGLRPLAEVTETARRVRSSNLRERITDGQLPAELSVLAGTFNEMMDRLEDSFQRLARFSADIAHELRTPVHNLRGEVEVALGRPRTDEEYREVLSSCLEECARLSQLIDSLLFLARAESPGTLITREQLDVGRELEGVRDFYEATAFEAGVKLQVSAPPGLGAALDRTLFQRAVGNLVANALAHTESGGTITLSACREGAGLNVEVADTGSGIAPEHLPHVFDRFYRADAARTSETGRVGLGLPIVQSIAALHGGRAAIQSTVGHGTRVTLAFPSAIDLRV